MAQIDTNRIAKQDVQQNLVPPALSKVGKETRECDFAEFKQDTPSPTDIDISVQERLAKPANDVSQHKLIVDGIPQITKVGFGIVRCVKSAISAVIALRKGFAESGINVCPNLTGIVVILDGEDRATSHKYLLGTRDTPKIPGIRWQRLVPNAKTWDGDGRRDHREAVMYKIPRIWRLLR